MGLKSGFQLDNAVGDGRVNCRSNGFGGDHRQSDETMNYFGNPQLHLVTLEGLLTRQDRTNQITYVGKESCQALNPNCVTN